MMKAPIRQKEASAWPGQVPTPPPMQAIPELHVRMFIPASFCPTQQGCAGPPHAWHVPTPPPAQIALAAVQVLPPQHGSPTPPHAVQVRPMPIAPVHTDPGALQVTLAQHG